MEDWRARLREAVERTNRKHWYIAEEAGIDPTTLSRILCGHLHPRFETVVRIARAAGVSVGSLIGEQAFPLAPHERAMLERAVEVVRRFVP